MALEYFSVALPALLTLFIAFLTYNIWNWYFDPLRKYPSPRSHILFRHLIHLTGDHVKVFKKWSKEYRERGLYVFEPVYIAKRLVLITPEVIKRVCTESKIFMRPTDVLLKIAPLIGKGVLSSDGESHAYQRRVLNPVFSPQQLKKYVPTFNKHVQILIEKWKNKISGKPEGEKIVVYNDLTALSFDFIGDVGFGYRFNALQSDQLHPFTRALKEAGEERFSPKIWKILLLYHVPFLQGFLNLFPNKQVLANKIAAETMDELIEKRKNELQAGDVPESQEKDFLSVMLKAQMAEENSKMTNSLIRDNIFTFLAGGQGTTRTSMIYILHALAMHLEIQEKLRSEIKLLMSAYEDITYDNLKNCTYLECVIKECLRLHPPFALLWRKCGTDQVVDGHHFPANEFIACGILTSNLDPNVFKDPETFNPDRFLTDAIPANAFLTFGYGIFGCIAKAFAMTSMKAIVANLLLTFRFSLDKEDMVLEKKIFLEIGTKKPIAIIVQSLH